MAAASDDEMDSLLVNFDQLHKEYSDVMFEIESLKAKRATEIKRCEALEITCAGLKKDKERMMKSHTEILGKLAEQLEYRPKYQSLLDQHNMMKEQILSKEKEHKKVVEHLKEENEAAVGELRMKIRYCQTQLSEKEAAIAQLQLELADCEASMDVLQNRLELLERNAESKYQHDIQELTENIQREVEAKNKLHKQLENAEHLASINRMKYEEHLRDLSSNRHVDMFKQKLMKLRKENEDLKRQLLASRR